MPTLRQHGTARSGRIVVAQVALLALLLAVLGRDPLGWLVAVPVAAALVALGFVRWRRRWLAAWLADGLRYLTRARTAPGGADPAALLAFVDPTTGFGEAPGVIEDSDGVVAVIELDGGPEGAAWPALPPLDELLTTGCDAVTLVVSAVPAGSAGLVGASYRQLTDGRVPARCRALLAIRVSRADVAWSGEDLRRTLAGSLRRVGRRLRQERLSHRQLTTEQAGAAIAELAPRQASAPTGESWSALWLGGLRQTALRVPRLDRLPAEVTEQLIARLLALPAASTTVGLSASAAGTDLVVRVAAGTAAGLAGAVGAGYRLLHTAGSVPQRLGGRQREGLAATLPLARPYSAGRAADGALPRGAPDGTVAGRAPDGTVAGRAPERAVRVALAPSGLMLGHNRHHRPVTVPLFRPEPTRAMLLGGVRAAQVLALRALALHARVIIQTARPGAWEPFLRAVIPQTGAVTVAPPGHPAPPAPAGPLVPQLIVLDLGRAPAPAVPAAAWRACLVVREEVCPADTGALARADLVILQPMPPDEAALVAGALGLDGSREWLSRIRADMVGAVSRLGAGRSSVRWAVLSTTDVERQVVGGPERVAIG